MGGAALDFKVLCSVMKQRLLLLAVLLAGCSIGNNPWKVAADSLPDELAKAKAAGVPLELSDLGLPRSVPADKNSAPLFLKAAAAMKAVPTRTDIERRLSEASIAHSLGSSVTRDRNALQPMIELAIEGSMKPSCDFGRDWSQGFDLTFAEYADLKGVVKLMAADAVLDAKSGNYRRAREKFAACFRISDGIAEEPTVIAMLVAIALDAITFRRFEQAASMASDSAAGLAELEQTLTMNRRPKSLEWAFGGEIVLSRISLRKLKTPQDLLARINPVDAGDAAVQPTGAGSEAAIARAPRAYFSKASEARMLEYWRIAWQSIKKGDLIASGREIDELAQEFALRKNPTYAVPAIIVPDFSSIGNSIVKNNTLLLLARAQIDLLQHKLRTGRFPAKLSDLQAAPKDPFSGKMLVYRPTKSGFKLYSVGPDGIDDGGTRTRQPNTGNSDLVVEHPFDDSRVAPR